jgi:hypothetical protein
MTQQQEAAIRAQSDTHNAALTAYGACFSGTEWLADINANGAKFPAMAAIVRSGVMAEGDRV